MINITIMRVVAPVSGNDCLWISALHLFGASRRLLLHAHAIMSGEFTGLEAAKGELATRRVWRQQLVIVIAGLLGSAFTLSWVSALVFS